MGNASLDVMYYVASMSNILVQKIQKEINMNESFDIISNMSVVKYSLSRNRDFCCGRRGNCPGAEYGNTNTPGRLIKICMEIRFTFTDSFQQKPINSK